MKFTVGGTGVESMSEIFLFSLWCSLLVLAIAGWFLNMWRVTHVLLSIDPVDEMFAARLVGIAIPLVGAILGYF